MFPFEKDKSSQKNKTSKYTLVYNWFLIHPKQHQYYINFIKANDIFIFRPFTKIKNAIFQSSARISLFRRLKSGEWYKTTYMGIKDYFNILF